MKPIDGKGGYFIHYSIFFRTLAGIEICAQHYFNLCVVGWLSGYDVLFMEPANTGADITAEEKSNFWWEKVMAADTIVTSQGKGLCFEIQVKAPCR